MAYSIHEELTKTSDKTAPSTDLVDFLTRSLAQEICDGVRGAQTYYRIVSRAREISNHINALIVEADTSKSWDRYLEYTAQIEPLEKLLFMVSQVVPEETMANGPLKPATIQDCLNNIKSWHDNRAVCRGVSKALHTRSGGPDSCLWKIPSGDGWDDDLTAAANHDDNSWVAVVVESLSDGLIDLTKQASKDLPDMQAVIEGLAKIQMSLEEDLVEDDAMVLSTRCFMVMHGIISVAAETDLKTDKTPEDEKVVEHLLAPKTWEWALRLINGLQSALDASSKPDENLQKDWDMYEDYLLMPLS